MHGGHADHGALAGDAGPDSRAPAADHQTWEHCPFGAAFGVALLAGDVAPEVPVVESLLEVIEPSIPIPFRPVSSYRARAPPSSRNHA